jgi:NADH-quinone oxidoreductase subunit L
MSGTLEKFMMLLAVAAGAIGWFIAHRMYHQRFAAAQLAAPARAGYNVLQNKYYVDEFYGLIIVKPLLALSKYFLEWVVDFAILGGLAWLLAGIASLSGAILQRWQSGNIRSYAAWLALGAAVLLYFVLAPHVFGAPSLHLGMAGH